jgi:SAM-dependent methyltransferase
VTEFTGERVVPGQVDADLWAEHLSRYRFAVNLTKDLGHRPAVLDIGCGTGYGTAALAEPASSATGIDLAPNAIAYARSHYQHPHLGFVAGSATALPFADASFDLITAFEVIEHLQDGNQLLAEARRVLRPGGVLLVSTPNATYYAQTRSQTGPNPFHVHEFEFDEFLKAVATVFPHCAPFLQNHTDAFAFYDPHASRPMDGYVEAISGGPTEAHFFLAVCSLRPLASLRNFIYIPAATNLLREREHHIELLNDELRTARAERDTMMRMNDEQASELEARYRWARQLEDELKQKATDLKTVVEALDAAESTVVERTQWAQRLDAERIAYLRSLHHVRASRWMRLGRKLGLGPQIDDPKIDKPQINKPKTDENV